jgi:hypothetical protein
VTGGADFLTLTPAVVGSVAEIGRDPRRSRLERQREATVAARGNAVGRGADRG